MEIDIIKDLISEEQAEIFAYSIYRDIANDLSKFIINNREGEGK